jgi:DNA-binding YbaB/EbfC family protein
MKFDLQNVLQQAQKMQSEMETIKRELDSKTITSDAGGGMIIAQMTGAQRLVSIKISPELISNGDVSMIEDLVVAAVNKSLKVSAEYAASEMAKVQSMLPNIPGLNLGF